MALTGFHLRVAQLLGQAVGNEGFALGGGYGLQAHKLSDRASNDLDAYVDKFVPEVFERAERAFVTRLTDEGLQARVVKDEDVFRAILVTDPRTDETIVVDLGYDYRENPPVMVEGIGPVLDIEDIVTGKVRAFVERGAERDYSDLDRILADGRWSPQDILAKAKSVFPDTTALTLAEKLDRADQLDLENYSAIGIGPRSLTAMQRRLSAAGDRLTSRPRQQR